MYSKLLTIRFLALSLALGTALMAFAGAGQAQELAAFEASTTEYVLDNGWTFIIVERPNAPVFSFATYVNVGSAQEVPGITGLAHMFEHMAFKGTPNIGSKNYRKEKKAIEELEAAYQAWQRERLSLEPDAGELEQLEAEFREKQQAAAEHVENNEFGEIIEREGGVGLNAFTNSDVTGYFYSLPSNKFELFAYLDSERFLHPVFREYYKERDVVMEERRLRTESQPIGRMIEQFVATAFVAHPYKQPTVGYMSDLQAITLSDAQAFYEKYYVPSNFVTAIVGDVNAKEIIPVLEKYFGRIPARPQPEDLRTVEPRQIAEKTIEIEDPSQPLFLEGYHIPAATHPDRAVWDAIDDVLSGGRTSRLYRKLVRDQRIAVGVGSFSGFPGDKYPALWITYAFPSRDATNEQVRDSIREEITRFKNEDITDEELQRFKTRAKAGLVRSLDDNQGIANNLVYYQTIFGDWRELFRHIERIDNVTKEDIRRVANAALVPANRTVGMIVTNPEAARTVLGQSGS